jgi:1-acyl-sn-glycerol-3-phosphate acyltransferase
MTKMLSLRQIPGDLAATSIATKAWPIIRPDLLAPKVFDEETLFKMGRLLLSAYMGLMLDVDIQRHGPLPDGPKILAVNHPTSIDPFYILTLLPEPVSVLITAAAFDKPLFGPYLRATGHIAAVRGSGGATVEAVSRQIEAGRSVAIFPEGALSPIGGFHRPHSGLARIALRTGAPVIPVGIGLQDDRIRVTETNIDGEKVTGHFYTSGPYAMTVGRPLYFEGDAQDRERVRTATTHIMNHIRSLAHESQSRIQPAKAVQASALPAFGLPAGAH